MFSHNRYLTQGAGFAEVCVCMCLFVGFMQVILNMQRKPESLSPVPVHIYVHTHTYVYTYIQPWAVHRGTSIAPQSEVDADTQKHTYIHTYIPIHTYMQPWAAHRGASIAPQSEMDAVISTIHSISDSTPRAGDASKEDHTAEFRHTLR